MSGQVIIPSPEVGGGSRLGGGGGNSRVTASQVNGFRIAAVVHRLGLNMELPNPTRNESLESFNLCLSLARGIDFSMANHEIPSRAQDLPLLLKKVCQCRNDAVLQAAVMVLMMSVKNACQSGWFSDKDAEELNNLAQEMASNFCTSMDFNTEPNGSNAVIATIMSRFYPRMKMGNILTFLEVKPGYGAYIRDFQISKHTRHSLDEKIRLFVAQTDSTETSSCLVNPTKVNILVNGKGVDRRNTVFTDTGPQMPTHVTHMLRYGTNLLQAVGQFNGNYIIVLARMTEISEIEVRTLQDYVQPNAVIVDPDSELIEGPSRISLNCPISLKRIRTPVKGHACKHLKCFDFENYMDMNAKRPSWRCPHCNHHCCFTEIRIDQNMVKVLKEVGEGVNDVIISSDGSWKAIMESGDNAEKRQDKFPRLDQDELTQPDSPGELMDLTEVDDVIDATSTCEAEERKVLPNTSANLSSVPNMTSSSESNSTNEARRSTLPQIEDNFWSGIYLSTFHSGTPSAMLDAQIGGILESSPCSVFSSPVFTDTVSPALNSGVGPLNANGLLANSALRNEITSPTALQLQQFQFGNSAVNNEYGRSLPIPWHISRTPVAVQALPAQAPTTISPRLRNSANTSIQNSHLAASQTPALSALGDGFNTNSSNIERQQPFSRSHPSALQVPRMSSQQQNSNSLATYQGYSGRQNEVQNSSPQQISNLRMPHSTNQSAGRLQQSAQSSGTFFQSQNSLGGSQGVSSLALGSSNNRFSAAQRAAQVTRAFQTPRPAALSGNVDLLGTSSVGGLSGALGSTQQSVPRPDVGANSTADKDWRPTGRMRGSLSGKAYSDALNQYIIRPTQQAQAGSTPPNLNPSASTPSAALEILMANRAALQAAGPSTASGSVCGASGAFSLEPTTGRQ